MTNLRAGTVFTLLLLSFVLILFIFTLDLGRVARLVPLKVVVPTLVLLVVQLVLELVPKLAQRFKRFEKLRFDKSEQLQEKTRIHSPVSVTENSRGKRELHMFAWILSLPVFIYFFGFLIAIPMFMLFYLRWRSGERWLFSILMTAGMWGLLYGVFVIALRTHFYEGLLWNWLVF